MRGLPGGRDDLLRLIARPTFFEYRDMLAGRAKRHVINELGLRHAWIPRKMTSRQVPFAKAPKRSIPWDDVPEARRAVMRAVKGKDTKPEMAVRRLIHGMGYRYRLHRKDLPGKPDLVFGPRKKVIFVHGCFWHQHSGAGCRGARMPLTRSQYWRPKLERNKERDSQNMADLNRLGWDVLVVWECCLKDIDRTSAALEAFLGGTGKVSWHG